MGQTGIEWTEATWGERFMSDLFHDDVPNEFRDEVVARAYMAPQHTYQFLTKHPRVMKSCFSRECPDGVLDCIAAAVDPKSTGAGDVQAERAASLWPWPNVWLGVTVEDQEHAHRIDTVLQIPAAVRFVSLEPLLGAVDVRPWLPLERCTECGWQGSQKAVGCVLDAGDCYRRECPQCAALDTIMPPDDDSEFLDWVIVGAETGPGARPMKPDWVRFIRDQCVEAGVPFFFKSHGDWLHETQVADSGPQYEAVKGVLVSRNVRRIHCWPDGSVSYRVGKKLAGRDFDGRQWNEFPAATVRQ